MRSHRPSALMLCSLAVTAVAGVCGACGNDESISIDAAPAVDAATDAAACPPVWTVDAAAGTSATVAGGALVLTGTNLVGSALEVYRDGLGGDFDVSFTIEAFTAGATGAFLQAAISERVPTPTRILSTALGTFPTVGVSAADQPGGPTDIQASAATTGTLRFARTGTTVTLTATAGATVATATATSFALQPLRVGVQLGSNMGTVAPASTARIGGFVVVAGAGVAADAFDCNSLIP